MTRQAEASQPDIERAAVGVLAGLGAEAMDALRAVMTIQELAAGEVLVRQGDVAEALYIVIEGQVTIALAEGGQQLGEIGPGAVVGEVAVLSGTRRTATVVAATATRVGVVDRADLERIIADHPELIDRLLASSVQRLRRSQLAAYLASLFGAVPAPLVDALMARLTFQRLSGGEVLFRPGDRSDAGFIVLSGRLKVTTFSRHGTATVEEIGRRQPIGWAGLLTGRPRNQAVVAIRETEVARLTAETFGWFTTTVPQASVPIMAELADRMERAATAPLFTADRASTFAVIGGPGADAADCARDLERALAPHGSTLVLGSGDLTWIGGRVPPSVFLDEREASHDFVVYITDASLTPWTDLALRQADHLVVFARADGDPASGEIARAIAARWSVEGAPRRTLVLLQEPSTVEPSGTAAWLDGYDVDQHLHVRRGSGADLERVGRLLAGRGVALVLGGGGARGYAHIGVIRAMEELGIPIDMVAGTSMGAMVAALVARGRHATQIEDGLAKLGGLLDVTLPIASISSGARIQRAIESTHGQLQIEDTWLPFFCVSTNLTEARPVIHRRGSLAHALRASASLPGILPPVHEAGNLLIDGGLLDTLPVGVMRSLNNGVRVIAVDVSPPVDVAAGAPFADHVSGWGLLWQRLRHRRGPRPLPGIAELLQRTVAVPGLFLRGQLQAAAPDLLIQPAVGRWRMLDLGKVRPIAAAGYASSIAQLREWWATQTTTRTGGS